MRFSSRTSRIEAVTECRQTNASLCARLAAQTPVMWTVCARRRSRSCRAPCGPSGSPSTNSSFTSSSLGRNMRSPRSPPKVQRVSRSAALDRSFMKESVVRVQMNGVGSAPARVDLFCLPQWAVAWGHSTVGSRSSVSSVLLVPTRTL